MNTSKRNSLWVTGILISLLAGCGGGGDQPAENLLPVEPGTVPVPSEREERIRELTASLETLRGKIEYTLEPFTVCDFASQCETLALGEYDGCGVADEYLAYNPFYFTLSFWSNDKVWLDEGLSEYNLKDAELDALLGQAGSCDSAPLEPVVGCVKRRCSADAEAIREYDEYMAKLVGDMASLRSDITELVGDAHCASSSDCKSVGYGHKPCGGPSSYLVYSVLATDENELLPKVEQYNQLDAEYARELGFGSDCAIVLPLPLACVENQCVEVNW